VQRHLEEFDFRWNSRKTHDTTGCPSRSRAARASGSTTGFLNFFNEGEDVLVKPEVEEPPEPVQLLLPFG
jgi:hypothetical protein